MKESELATITTGEATYCPEDNKLRLYVGRVTREEFLALRAEGWTVTPKQREAGGCDFVAVWTPERRDTALLYGEGVIGDEDQSPAERAADRAERFGGYRDKRFTEATGHADAYDAQPMAHGYQSQARAERAAARHDRIGDRATDAWGKAEYWQQRTAGVIAHALHVSTPAVRMGRIKELEADLRRVEKSLSEYAAKYRTWQNIAAMEDEEKATNLARRFADYDHGDYKHPETGERASLYRIAEKLTGKQLAELWLSHHSEPRTETDWTQHLKLRLAYENQMLESQGGRAAHVEMEVGGWIGKHQIRKVNRSNVSGRVVSVQIMHPEGFKGYTRESGYREYAVRPALVTLNIERASKDVYRPPTEADKRALAEAIKAAKAKAPKKAPCLLINPTEADAARLVAIWDERRLAAFNARHGSNAQFYEFKPCSVVKITQAAYSANSKGAYARAETRTLHANAELADHKSELYSSERAKREERIGPPICSIRVAGYDAIQVIILTDKPQKSLPANVWEALQVAAGEVVAA